MPSTPCRHFRTLQDLSTEELKRIILRAIELKQQRQNNQPNSNLQGKVLAMIFEKASTRTRISFEAGIIQMGGQALFISTKDSQIGRGESIADTAKVISSMVDAIMIRTDKHQKLLELAEYSSVPVINGLTDTHHPCQLLADIMTVAECYHGMDHLTELTFAWIGDGNNMCNSTIELAHMLNFRLNIHTPPNYQPQFNGLKNTTNIHFFDHPEEAIKDAHIVSTDVWASMGDEDESTQRMKDFAHCQVNTKRMALAHPEAIFLHCLPAHRGKEVTAEVIDGHQSKVWQQAENRLHVQKALMEFLFS